MAAAEFFSFRETGIDNVQAVVEALHAHPELPHTPTSLAVAAGISVRALHEAFHPAPTGSSGPQNAQPEFDELDVDLTVPPA